MQAQSPVHAAPDQPPEEPVAAGVWRPLGKFVAGSAGVMLAVAVLSDVAGMFGVLPREWPPFSYALLGIGIGLGLVAVLMRLLLARRGEPRTARATFLDLVAFGTLLGTWLLRGHPEIPPDPPLVVAALVALLLLAGSAWLRRRARSVSP
ncbi:hypothetical protein BH23GEM9_BH23GEM9_21550 [soil metagenome]